MVVHEDVCNVLGMAQKEKWVGGLTGSLRLPWNFLIVNQNEISFDIEVVQEDR